MTLFETVKGHISTREAVEHYGVDVSRRGMALCPFHNDHTPSLYVDDTHYYCYGCGEYGDTVNFVARLFDLTQTEAARKLIADFHLALGKPPKASIQRQLNIRTEAQRLKENEALCFSVLTKYRQRLCEWKLIYAPHTPEDEPDRRFVEACKYLDWVEYHLDLLAIGDSYERNDVVNYLMDDDRIKKLQQHLRKEEHSEQEYPDFAL